MKYTLLHPSRGRANQALITRDKWFNSLSGKHEVEHLLSVDESDPQKHQYIELFKDSQVTTLIISDSQSVVEATNHIAKYAEGNILIYLSDDFDCPLHWDELISKKVTDTIPHYSHIPDNEVKWLLKVDDMLQPFWKDVLTIPIMSKALYDELGYFWHPQYKSMFVDQDLFHTVKNMGCMFDAPDLKFEHHHYSVGKAPKDSTYNRSDLNWKQGQELYAKRKQQNFPR